MEIDQAVADRLRHLRENVLKMTLESFGEAIDLTAPMVQLMEAYKRKITGRTRNSICSAFNVSRAWIDSGAGEIFTLSRIADPPSEYDLHGGYKPDPEKASGFRGDSAEWMAMGKLHDLLSGGNDVFKRAILANLDAFSIAKDIQSKNEELSGQVNALRNENTTLAARLDTLEQQLTQKGLVVIESTADARSKTGPGR
jgi:hypothetical protein